MRVSTIMKALRIIYDHGQPCSALAFARKMFPKSPGWSKPTKRPREGGPSYGACMISSASGFLGRLVELGVIEEFGGNYRLSPGGMDYLLREGLASFARQSVPGSPAASR